MEDNNKKLDERDFHHGEGHSIPIILRLVWATFFVVAITYLSKFMWPNLMMWLNK